MQGPKVNSNAVCQICFTITSVCLMHIWMDIYVYVCMYVRMCLCMCVQPIDTMYINS